MSSKRTVEPSSIRDRYLGLRVDDKRRQRRYHRKAAQWWLRQNPVKESFQRLAKLHFRDARNG